LQCNVIRATMNARTPVSRRRRRTRRIGSGSRPGGSGSTASQSGARHSSRSWCSARSWWQCRRACTERTAWRCTHLHRRESSPDVPLPLFNTSPKHLPPPSKIRGRRLYVLGSAVQSMLVRLVC